MTTPAEPTPRRRKDHPMFRSRKRAAALIAGLALITTACSSTGGKQEEVAAPGAAAGRATTPEMTFAMVTHAGPGQTFWDIERKGGEAAAAKDNVKLQYSSDPDAPSRPP
jgi:simple sugar transport system substrate-binding protein